MSKKVAILAVNPVNGSGLFQYLEAFFENGIEFNTFAVAPSAEISTNSGITLRTNATVATLLGKEKEYDALVFACGNAMPVFMQNAEQPWNQAMMTVIKAFAEKGKIIAGHCVFALLLDNLGIASGQKVALHPYIKDVVQQCIGTDEPVQINGNIFTAQCEHTIEVMLPALLAALK